MPPPPDAVESHVGSLSWPVKAGQRCQAREAGCAEQGQSRADTRPWQETQGDGKPGVGETASRPGTAKWLPLPLGGGETIPPEHLRLALGRDVETPLAEGGDQLPAMKAQQSVVRRPPDYD